VRRCIVGFFDARPGFVEADVAITKAELYAFLRARDSGVVSTIGSDGSPQSARVYIVTTPELDLVFYTLQTNRKCLNLRRDPRLSAVIGCDDEHTVQYEGIAEEVDEHGFADIKKLFLAAQPQRSGMVDWPGLTFFRVKPVWIRFSDYGKPWHVDEFAFPENNPEERRARFVFFRRRDKS
jgi:hypothetical protein